VIAVAATGRGGSCMLAYAELAVRVARRSDPEPLEAACTAALGRGWRETPFLIGGCPEHVEVVKTPHAGTGGPPRGTGGEGET